MPDRAHSGPFHGRLRTFILMLSRFCLLPAVVAVGVVIAGCGGSSTSTAASPPSSTTSPGPKPAGAAAASTSAPTKVTSGRLAVKTDEFAFAPKSIQASAGKLRVSLRNSGKTVHEFVVLRTSAAPGSLKVGADGRVSEKKSVGEVSETKAGASKTSSITLTPGQYVFVCNIPGHYKSGMYGRLTVR
jgi:uncharacterized cupredoxin-like copper-binding protein